MASSDALLFFLLGLLYFVSFLLALLRCIVLFRHRLVWKQTQLFYVWILIQTLLRTISFSVAMLGTDSDHYDILYLILNVPDSLFISAYLILFWQLVSVYVLTHIPSAHAIVSGIATKRMKQTASTIIILNCLWLVSEAILYLCIIISKLRPSDKDSEMAGVDLGLPVLVLAACCYLQYRYSGVPFKSRTMRLMLKKCNRVTLIWSICRLLRGALGLLTQFGLKMSMIHDVTDNNPGHVVASIIYIVILLVSEVLCYFFVLDYGFFGKFLFTESEQPVADASMTGSPLQASTSQRPLMSLANSTFVDSSTIEELEELPTRRHALGQVFKSRLNGEIVAVRRISFPRMNTYVFEEFLDEIEALKNVEFRHVLPLIGGCFDQPTVRVIMPFVPEGSLHALLHTRKAKLTMHEKLTIAREVCLGMRELYAEEKPHGHLTSHNVLMDNKEAKVSDVGLSKLKKFAGVVINYTNKCAWSSPEQLSHRSKSASKVKESDDVYSFGVILWELVSEEEPFPSVTVDRLRELVAGQQLRPEIPPATDEELSQLIRSCWNGDAAHRPTFDGVLENLNRLLDA